jgi:tetratricopeptide (TPR) repeat protein
MSLLLEALKKAEKAKEEAQRRARAENAEAGASSGAAAAERPVVTRDKLPDISPSLEIVSDDLSPPPAAEAALPQAAPPRAAARPSAEQESAGRASAKKVFEAKFREPNPRMPFYITMGVLGVFVVGTVVYFWYQLRPPPSLVNLNPPGAAAPVAEARPVPTAATTTAPTAAAGTIPGLPSAPLAQAPAAPEPRKPQPQVETPRLAPRLLPPRPVPAPVAEPQASVKGPQAGVNGPQASVSRPPAQVQPNVAAGYAAYVAGDLAAARTQYEQALREEPANRDALLGLGAVELRAGRYEVAEGLYLRLLQADPRDPLAQAALISLRAGRSDPLATESRVKTLLAAEPAAHALNFTLGNQLAQQNRWAEAQHEYFKAYIAEPDNADFAYNLAVSLDHLRQPRQALDYYQRAIGLAEKRGAGFDLETARLRARELSQ